MIAALDRDQIEALKRQVEEDYKLDMAAIERFQRRFTGGNTTSPALTSAPSATTATVSEIRGAELRGTEIRSAEMRGPEPRGAIVPIPEPVGQSEPDELTGSLRSMFSTYRR